MSNSVLFFKSPSCPVCRNVEPVFSDIADTFKNSIDVETIDITKNMQKAVDHGVMSVPTIVFLSSGSEIERITGMVSPDKLNQAFEKMQGT